MVELSSTESVMRNPNLNLDLLQIEEKMLALGLLSIEDIREPKNISNSDLEVGRVE